MKDNKSKVVFADMVSQKEANVYAIRRMVQNIEILVYSRLIWKSAQDLAIVALEKVVRDNEHQLEIVVEESAVAEHEVNGAVGAAV